MPNHLWKRREVRKKDTNKVKTNPKYKCLNEDGSEEDDDDINKQDELQNLSSKEMDFRETIIKYESK